MLRARDMTDRPVLTVLQQHGRHPAEGEVADGELLRRFAEGCDEAAFELLVWRHERMVMGVCRRVLGDRHDAEDAFQASFLALARRANTIGRRESVGAWLHRVACRVALRARATAAARAARERTDVDLAALPVADEPGPGAVSADLRALLDRAIDGLPEKYRAPVVLCHLEGQTYAEVARKLGCPKGRRPPAGP
jgi:RNA polymerase sigma factor (sigma-70 family)